MKFQVSSSLTYEVRSASTLILCIHALRTPTQAVLEEVFTTEPYLKMEELTSVGGQNRFVRLEVNEPMPLTVSYKATVDTEFDLIGQEQLDAVPVVQLDGEVIPFLFPSRYCQSDKLYRLAQSKFGHIDGVYARVVAITDWIYKNVEYLSGVTTAQTSAFDTIIERAGVCRDFAHLGIALCRALTIPARYFTGYAYQLNPPDFHACFEAFIGGQWILFDATRLAPLNGLVKIATGRDAADAAVASIFGNVTGTSMQVDCQVLDLGFVPFTRRKAKTRALSVPG
jgi:transglutaminase-like putative cysteine protease